MNEPSAALTDIEVEGLFAIMQKLVGEGKSIIFISHKMREVLRISDRITILRLGKVVGTVDPRRDRRPEARRHDDWQRADRVTL